MRKENQLKKLLDKTEFGSMTFERSDQSFVFEKIRGEQIKITQRNKKTRIPAVIATTIAAAAILFILLMQTPLADQIQSAFSKQTSMFLRSDDPGLQAVGKKNYGMKVNQSSESSGIKVTIKEIMYDGLRIAIGYEVESKTKFVGPVDNSKVSVNGKMLQNVIESSQPLDSTSDESYKPTHHFKGVTSLSIADKLPQKFTIHMQFYGNQNLSLTPKSSATTKGKWEFSIPVEKKGTIYVIKPKEQVHSGSTTIRVDQITLAPSGTEVTVSKEEDGKGLPAKVQYRILDDKGNLLPSFGQMRGTGEQKNGKIIMHQKDLYSPAEGLPSYLTVQPYTINDSAHNPNKNIDTIKSISERLPMTFPQNNGAIIVNKIEESKGNKRLKIYYEVKGDLPEVRIGTLMMMIGRKPTNQKDFLVDQNYQESYLSNKREKIAEFATGLRKELYIKVSNLNPVLYKDLELKIPLKKEELMKK